LDLGVGLEVLAFDPRDGDRQLAGQLDGGVLPAPASASARSAKRTMMDWMLFMVAS
jgi:hypothetical protein